MRKFGEVVKVASADDWRERLELTAKGMKTPKSLPPSRPRIQKPQPRPLLELPSKNVFTKPELQPPYTTIDINQTEELIDLDELKKYGRYAIITQDDDYKKQFVISDVVSAIDEIDNPEYAQAVEYNRQIEEQNKWALDKYEAEHEFLMSRYKKDVEEYRKQFGEYKEPEVGDNKPFHNTGKWMYGADGKVEAVGELEKNPVPVMGWDSVVVGYAEEKQPVRIKRQQPGIYEDHTEWDAYVKERQAKQDTDRFGAWKTTGEPIKKIDYAAMLDDVKTDEEDE